MWRKPVTRDVSNPDTSRCVSDEHPENIELMAVALDVSKLETSRLVSEEQPSNMSRMSGTPEVFQPLKSSVTSDEQWANMLRSPKPPSSVVETSHPDKSSAVRDEQPQNIHAKLDEAGRQPVKSTDKSDVHPHDRTGWLFRRVGALFKKCTRAKLTRLVTIQNPTPSVRPGRRPQAGIWDTFCPGFQLVDAA